MMEKLIQAFQQTYGKAPAVLSAAPGRLEVLGNHTDYNEGVVLSCAVEQRTFVAMAPRQDSQCNLKDLRDLSSGSFDLQRFDEEASPRWINYIKGVVSELAARKIQVGGFDAEIFSTVPLSAGMSSSAALEVAISFALKEIFSIQLSNADWARVGQGVENNYLGLKSGLLDQFSSIFGAANRMILSDFRSVEVVKTVPLDANYLFLVVNSMIKHNLVDSAYNSRREMCESAAAKLGVKALRDATTAQLQANRAKLTDGEYRRAMHVVGECERVMQGVQALENNDVAGFGRLLWESHDSSKVNFENSTEELDELVRLSHEIPGCVGARLSGGGFGGISIHLVRRDAVDAYEQEIKKRFAAKYQVEPETIRCALGAGASVKNL